MEKHTRVYPAEKANGGWLGKLIMFLSLVVIFSGLAGRDVDGDLSIQAEPSATPIPLHESFDETITETAFTLPASTWYTLQLGAFETEEAAKEMAEQYTRRGAAGYVWQDGRYRVLAAVYPSRDDAQSVRQRLSQQHRVDSYLYEVSLPALQLRLSGMKGQMDILQAAFLHADDLIRQLYQLSAAMDRQEMSVAECIEALLPLQDNAQTVTLRLNQRFTKPRHAAVTGLINLFDSFSSFVRNCDETQSSVAIGSEVKHQTILSLHMLKHVYDTISHT